LDRIEQTEFKAQGYERVKDIFLFASYTGLSYVDLKELSPNHLVRGIKGNLWIHTQRAKTNEAVKIPLLPKAKEILAKYSNLNQQEIKGKLLPVYSNQKTNKYLKEIAKACGIHKNISFHVARHTFATTVTLSNGVPIETVSKLLGHTKLTTTQIYARVLQKKVGEDMEHLIQHYENKEKQERNTQISTKN
jgi:integrase